MSILNEQIQFPVDSSIIVKRKDDPHFTFPYHYHREYELVYVEKGYGKRFVSGSVAPFSDGDMVLLAPYVPHCWESDTIFFRNSPELRVKGIVVQMPNDFFKTVISSYPEFSGIKQLLEQSNYGIKVNDHTRDIAATMLHELLAMNGLKRLFHFLELLEFIYIHKGFETISKHANINEDVIENTRLGKVFGFINNNYSKPIHLDDLCLITGLTPTGFSLWFKRNTAKNFSNFLQEFRISKACELLRNKENTEKKISEISFIVGFENLSNFNRAFKKITGLSPNQYKKLFVLM